ncbi:MAG: hypothetical protein D3M94_08820 [Rhodocyclales bacterium GT-UBC]|nr:MAG: hypothetical protein D3M94_08820 [Rhodocyclales bacterium GT-UBC]
MNKSSMKPPNLLGTQRGVVLITAVMFLVVLSLLAISMMKTSILEERMVASNRDWSNAFQAAESALRDAEREIKDSTRISGQTGFVALCSSSSAPKGGGLCLPNNCTSTASNGNCSPIWVHLSTVQNDSGWKTGSGTSKSIQYGGITNAAALSGVGAQPRYIIEVLTVPSAGSQKVQPGQAQLDYLYRVTAVGFGVNVQSRVMLQSMVRPH